MPQFAKTWPTLLRLVLHFATPTHISREAFYLTCLYCALLHQAIGVTIGSLAARAARSNWDIALPVLELPTKFATTSGRPWLVSFIGLPMWAGWAAALPALLATVLLFLDQNITARVANHPRYKQVKGRDTDSLTDGMHGDMFIISWLIVATSVLGLPWMVGATTRYVLGINLLVSISHKLIAFEPTVRTRISHKVSSFTHLQNCRARAVAYIDESRRDNYRVSGTALFEFRYSRADWHGCGVDCTAIPLTASSISGSFGCILVPRQH